MNREVQQALLERGVSSRMAEKAAKATIKGFENTLALYDDEGKTDPGKLVNMLKEGTGRHYKPRNTPPPLQPGYFYCTACKAPFDREAAIETRGMKGSSWCDECAKPARGPEQR